ncbi:MAG TPA: glycoside hydrolase family 125 protein [Chitinophagaceae bacterium]|nr:glycoside hydrolase family 125 protein [Chitinophagaceae bacterium]
MSTRRKFIRYTSLLSSALIFDRNSVFALHENACKPGRPGVADRKFVSEAVEQTILKLKKQIADPELACLFENCFPNTLDTTVDFEMIDGKPDTFVITGDIDAMWLRDSTAQVWPYLPLVKEDQKLKQLIAGVINRQKKFIKLDPYANAFYKDFNKKSEWSSDLTAMKPGIHERKWEIDSLCYPIRLSYNYWKLTGDTSVFDKEWEDTIALTVRTFKEQQRKTGDGPYTFQRSTSWATDGVPLAGYGYPVKPVGLICSIFRPSDDATIFPFLVPSNFFAVVSLEQAAEMVSKIRNNASLANECSNLAKEVKQALQQYAIVNHEKFGKLYAYEVNGFGSFNLMDDSNVPSLLSLPYLNAVRSDDAIYANTRKYILSENNPFFFKGKAAEGIGGPHGGMNTIWPLSITMRGLTSNSADEVKQSLHLLKTTHAGTGFMHEAFHKDDPSKFSRKWFAWANTLFGEFVIHTHDKFPGVLKNQNI